MNRKVYYVTSRNTNYRWYTRNPDDFYIMAHKSALSKSPLYSHSFYDNMEFKEITVPATIAWVNYVLDNNEFITQREFDTVVYNTTRYKQSIGRGYRKLEEISNYKEGDIVIAKNKVSNVPWIMKLGKHQIKTDGEQRWGLIIGFSTLEKVLISKFGSVYVKYEDIIRVASGEEQEYFKYCEREGRVIESSTVNLSTILKVNEKYDNIEIYETYTPHRNITTELISFKSSRKKENKEKSKTIKLKINKIENYEY